MKTEQRRHKRILAVLYAVLSIVPELSRAACHNCNRTFEDQSSGVVQSPNYPDRYPDECSCVWNLTSSTGSAIHLTVEHLNLKETSNAGTVGRCYDFLYIYHRLSGKKTKVAKLCGSSVADLDEKEYSIGATSPDPNIVTIEFSSDYSTQFSGFSIAFTMDEQTTTSMLTTEQQITTTTLQTTTTTTTTTATTAVTTTTTFPASTASTTVAFNISSIAISLGKNTGSNNNNSNMTTFIVVGVVSLLVVVLLLVLTIWYRKRKHEKLTGNEDMIFRNLTNENEDDGTDEYGRPRENTYVEIPLLSSDELQTTCNGVNTKDRRDSTASIDSVVRAKLENVFQSSPERTSTTSQNKHPTHQSNQVYSMAEDSASVGGTYLSPSSIAVSSPALPPPNSSFSSQKEAKRTEEKNGSQCSPREETYDVPTSPPCEPPDRRGDSLYDCPRPPSGSNPSSSFSFSSLHRHSGDQEKIEAESKYCTMKSGEEMNEFSGDCASKANDDVTKPCNDEGALYVPMK